MQRNCTFLREIIDGKNATGKDLPLSALDKVSNFSFGFAVLLSAIIGVSAAISSFNQKERGMTKKVQNQSDTEQRSFHGFPPAPANPNPGNANTGSPSPSTTSNSGNASGTGSTSGTGAANSGGESGKK
jgi:hypothetical protein